MPPSIADVPVMARSKLVPKTGHTTIVDALKAAEARFGDRNSTSLKLHQEAAKSLPGGNTRSVLHTLPFPVFLKSGRGHQVTSEDSHTYADLVGELTAGLYGHSQQLIQEALILTIQTVGLNLGGTSKCIYTNCM
jgi:glutamate-1-semialdehyde 2,1-aminomutase